MKFIANSLALSSTARMLQKVINTKNPLPILSNILCKITRHFEDKYTMEMSAYDGDVYLSRFVALEQADGEVTFCVEAHYLTAALSELSTEPVTLDVDKEQNKLTLKYESGETFFPLSDELEYPTIPDEEMPETLTLDMGLLTRALKRSLWTAAKDDLRPQMNGAYIELEDGCANIVTSNGHSLVLTRQQLANYDTNRIGSFIMPRKPATLLLALAALTDDDDSVFMEWNDKKAKIEIGTFTMILCQPEAKYPNYRALIRQSSPYTAKIDKDTMIKAVKQVVPFSNSSSQFIMLNFSKGSLNITADDFDFSRGSSYKISIEYDDVDMAIGTKGDSILSLLSKLNNPEVTMEFANPSLSMLFKDQDGDAEITMLLMPMLIN